MTYDGVVFDHDGVLVDVADGEALTTAVEDAFRRAGVDEARPADVDALTVGVEAETVERVADRYGVDPARLWTAREAAVHDCLQREVRAGRKGPYDDVAVLRDLNCPLGVASNNQARTVSFVLDHHGLAGLFGHVAARESTFESLATKKPHPSLVAAAVAGLGVEEPLYVGDSETDVVAARRAGVDAAYLRRPHNADRALDAEPTHEVESLRDVAALFE